MKSITSAINEMAVRIAPDYPKIDECNTYEQLYAIEQSYEGLKQANDDCHKLIKMIMDAFRETGFSFATDDEKDVDY